jgi:hypothetical protein
MPDNSVVGKYFEHESFEPLFAKALATVSAEIGFVPEIELDRRTIYDASKVWRVRIKGEWQGKPAVLRLENIKLEREEEGIRGAFRAQLQQTANVRPPETYLHVAFDATRGYGYSLDEFVEGETLFDPAGDPAVAARAFALFYRELRTAVTTPFWPAPQEDAVALTVKQMQDNWLTLAEKQNAAWVASLRPALEPILTLLRTRLAGRELQFMHAHLAGKDVRQNNAGEYIVFANHMWSWRQPGYDLSFPTWGQWLARPESAWNSVGIQAVTTAWEHEVRTSLADLVSLDVWHLMLLNRIFGSVLLDVPAMGRKPGFSKEAVQPLVDALLEEAKRIQGLLV